MLLPQYAKLCGSLYACFIEIILCTLFHIACAVVEGSSAFVAGREYGAEELEELLDGFDHGRYSGVGLMGVMPFFARRAYRGEGFVFGLNIRSASVVDCYRGAAKPEY